jgi:hypothetical protein
MHVPKVGTASLKYSNVLFEIIKIFETSREFEHHISVLRVSYDKTKIAFF